MYKYFKIVLVPQLNHVFYGCINDMLCDLIFRHISKIHQKGVFFIVKKLEKLRYVLVHLTQRNMWPNVITWWVIKEMVRTHTNFFKVQNQQVLLFFFLLIAHLVACHKYIHHSTLFSIYRPLTLALPFWFLKK